METLTKVINQETYISRVPGLFPFYANFFKEKTDDPFVITKPETNCWSQVIPNMIVPGNVDVTVYETGNETVSNEPGITNDVHSYKTIMDYYYQLYENSGIVMSNRYHWFGEDIIDKNKTFAQWVELGIGRFLTPINTELSDPYYEWLYLGLLDSYKEDLDTKYTNAYDNYVYRQERLCKFDNGETDKFGFIYYALTPEMMREQTFPDKSYLYVDNTNVNGGYLGIDLTYQNGDIIINNNTGSILTFNCHIQERKNSEGENPVNTTLIVEPGTYLFHLQTIGDRDVNNNFNQRFDLLSVDKVQLDPEKFDIKEVDKQLCCVYNKFIACGGWFYWQLVHSQKLSDFIERIKQMFYDCSRDDKMSGVSPNTLDLNIELLFNNSSLDLGVLTPLIREWDEKEIYYSGDIVVFTNGENSTPKCYICRIDPESYVFGKDNSPLDERKWEKLTHTPSQWENGETYTVSGKTHSKLQSLRRVKDFFDGYSGKMTPKFPEDWLYYYRYGATNINHQDIGNQTYHYGDFLEKVEVDKDEYTIKITYWIDALLKKVDDEFVLDKETNNGMFNGVQYVDTYQFETGSDLDLLFRNEYKVNGVVVDPEKYLSGEYDIYKSYETSDDISKYFYDHYVKFEFNGFASIRTVNISDGLSNSLRQYIECDYFKKSFYNGLDDLDYSYVVHHPYSLRMHAKPIINSEIIVDRGNTQAFEKHIRLSEVKTLEDMVNFNNGSFFATVSNDITY